MNRFMFLLSAQAESTTPPSEAVIGLLGIIVLFIIVSIVRSSKKKKTRRKLEMQQREMELQSQGITIISKMKYIDGLPIVTGTECELVSFIDKITLKVSGTEFNLDKSKLTDVCIKTDTEIQKQYVSSVGGAVGGAILFGGLGAVVGGRAKEKKTTAITKYLIFTYSNNNEIKYVSFQIFPENIMSANKFVEEFKSTGRTSTIVNL